MKRIIFFCVIQLIIKTVFAVNFSVDGISYATRNATSVKVVRSRTYTGNITIPASVTYSGQTYTITAVGDSAFYGCYNLNEVSLPTTVISIGNSAFGYCFALSTVNMPSTLTSIGSNAFGGCVNLTGISLPSILQTIGAGAFRACNGSIAVDANNTTYSALNGVLYNKTQTTLIQCPTSVSSVKIPNTVTSIGDDAFWGCVNLTAVFMPDAVSTIGYGAFTFCNKMETFTVPSLVNKINSTVFLGCSGLNALTLPTVVNSIDKAAFWNCSGLRSFNVYSQNPVSLSDSLVFFGIDKKACTLYVPFGSGNAYRSATIWSGFSSIAEMQITAIESLQKPENDFLFNRNLKMIELTGAHLPALIYVFDISGKLILKNTVLANETPSLGLMQNGLYIVTARIGGKISSSRIVLSSGFNQ